MNYGVGQQASADPRKLRSWDGPSEMSKIEARGTDPWASTQTSDWGLTLARQLSVRSVECSSWGGISL